MGLRTFIGLFGLVLAGALLGWLVSGERSGTRVSAPEGAQRPVAERESAPLEAVEQVVETPEREAVENGAAGRADEAAADPAGWPGTCSVFGKIVDAAGGAVDVGSVVARGETGETRAARLVDARYSIADLAPGRWWITTVHTGYEPAEEVVDLARTDEALRLDLVLTPAALLAVCLRTAGGTPFVEALEPGVRPPELIAVATSKSPGKRLSVEPAARGAWTAWDDADRELPDDAFLGWLRLREGPPAYVSLLLGEVVLATEYVPAGAEKVTFVLEPATVEETLATLRLRMLDATGAPAVKATVLLEHAGADATVFLVADDGTFELRRTPGSYRLMVSLPGHATHIEDLWLGPGLTDLGTLRLERAVGLRGAIVDPAGQPLTAAVYASLRVQCAPASEDAGGSLDDVQIGVIVAARSSTTFGVQPDGSFSLDLDAGRYALRALGPDWISPVLSLKVGREPLEDVVLHVYPPSVAVLNLAHGDWEGWRYAVLDEKENAARAGRLTGTAPVRLELPPGSYELRLTDSEGVGREDMPFDLGEETLVIDLTL